MLSGPEILLKNLLGIDPKQMQETVVNMVNQVNQIHGFMAEIRDRLDIIERKLECDKPQPLLLPSQEKVACHGS